MRSFPGNIAAGVAMAVGLLLVAPAAVFSQETMTPTPSPAAVGTGRPVRFTFWNVEWFPGRRPNAGVRAQANHVAAVVPVVQRLDPDVLGLEEVGEEAGARRIIEQLPDFHLDVVTGFIREGTGELTHQQTVLASRLPLLNAWWESWKKAANGGPAPARGFAFAAYQPAPGQVLLVYGVHLKSNRVDNSGGGVDPIVQRDESARQLLAHQQAMAAAYGKLGNVTIVVGGDMNTSLDDARYLREQSLRSWQKGGFAWVFKEVPFPQRITLPGEGRYPDACFDHIFFRDGGSGARLVSASVERTGRNCSDHRPVSAAIALQ
ncbi:MAG: endonuclease/exonuclease/phosphatase family protein [Verrucomicrobia bacterium]|nr:endonuclease/exonuclease/phosphatase family protein [Verrucomicrobiota bacterium]